jgi:hypothetical protein
MGPYLSIVVAWCFGFGGSLLMSMIALAAAPISWWTEIEAVLLVALGVVSAIGLFRTLRRRHQIRRRDVGRQRWLAALSWLIVITLATAVVFLFDG